MKTPLKLSIITITLALLLSVGNLHAQHADANNPGLVSTAWRMVENISENSHPDRTMYFRKNLTFESHNSDGTIYNGGKYSVINANTFVTVHYGAQTANLFTFTIKNDTLHFKGNFINFDESERRMDYIPIEEIFVKIKDWVDEYNGIKFSDDALLSTALEKSAKEGKLIFMDCYTQWCGPCKYLAANVFPLKEVGDFYNKNFINLSFDMETPEGRRIATKYGVRAYPTLLFLNSKGEVEHQSIGCGGAEHLLQLGKTAMDSANNLKALQLKIKKGDRSAETLIAYLSANAYAPDQKTLLSEYFKNKNLEQRLSDPSWRLFEWFENDVESPQFKFFAKHWAEFEKKHGKKAVRDKLWYLLNANMRDSIKYNSLRKVNPALFGEHKSFAIFQQAFSKARSNKSDLTCWNNLLKAAKPYLAQDSIEAYQYNETSWYIYENYKTFQDAPALTLAKTWSEKSLQLLPEEQQYQDTYAHILFELGEVQEAINYEEKALKGAMAKKTDSVKFFTDELGRFQKALK
ncbi:MAG TPA: thioredoxin domain-containing protein [Paludibacter sp.]|nr:thioredoxin domain-containing protein [Paludibacter sp.]